MKEIKFKVWDTKGKIMSKPFTFGDLFGYEGEVNAVTLQHPFSGQGQEENFIIASHLGGSPVYPQHKALNGVNPSLVFLQFTGLKDKNGKEIYEGDILKAPDGWQGVVEWHREDYINGFYCRGGGLYTGRMENLELVGNVYENPELLEAIK